MKEEFLKLIFSFFLVSLVGCGDISKQFEGRYYGDFNYPPPTTSQDNGGDNYDGNNGNILKGISISEWRIEDTKGYPEGYPCHPKGNDDGEINPGEEFQFIFVFKNNDPYDYYGMSAFLSSPSSAILIQNNEIKIGTIYKNRSTNELKGGCSKIIPDVEPPLEIPLNVSIKNEFESFEETITLVVVPIKAEIVFHYGEIDDGQKDGVGDADGQVEPGEKIAWRVYFKNKGTSSTQGIKITLSSDDPYFIIKEGQSYIGELKGGESRLADADGDPYFGNTYSFYFQISSSCPSNYSIPVSFVIEDRYGNKWIDQTEIDVY